MHSDIHGTFKALGDPTRCRIVSLLAQQDMTIGEVADQFEMTRAAVKKHLAVLERGRLVSVHVKGRERVNRLEPSGLKSASDWINHFNQFWDDRLDRLKTAIEAQESETKND